MPCVNPAPRLVVVFIDFAGKNNVERAKRAFRTCTCYRFTAQDQTSCADALPLHSRLHVHLSGCATSLIDNAAESAVRMSMETCTVNSSLSAHKNAIYEQCGSWYVGLHLDVDAAIRPFVRPSVCSVFWFSYVIPFARWRHADVAVSHAFDRGQRSRLCRHPMLS